MAPSQRPNNDASSLEELDTSANQEHGSNGHRRPKRTSFLLETMSMTAAGVMSTGQLLQYYKEGALYYCRYGDSPGIYAVNGRSDSAYLLLGGNVDIIPASDNEVGITENSITIRVTHKSFEGSKIVTLTRNGKTWENYYSLEKYVITPTNRADKDLLWTALKQMSINARVAHPELYFQPSDVLGWLGGKWGRVNGYIYPDRVVVGNGLGRISKWPQKIPTDYISLPKVIHASTIRELLDFWGLSRTMFPLAALGMCEYIMYPLGDGVLRWQLELFAPSGMLKTTVVNYFLRMFFGSGYSHETPTTLYRDDSKIGRNILTSRLPYHAYLTYDMNRKPGQYDYEKQQTERTDSLSLYGDSDTGPAKSNIDGKSLSERPGHRGAIIRTGESNPRIYTLQTLHRSPESRAVTYIIEESSSNIGDDLFSKSKRITDLFPELDAFSIAHVQWILSFDDGSHMVRWKKLRDLADQMIEEQLYSGNYPNSHFRRREQLCDIVTGLLSICQFMRSYDLVKGSKNVIDGGCELADYIESIIPAFIMERLQDSHDLISQFMELEGPSPLHAQAQAVIEAIRNKLTMGEFYVTDVPEKFHVDVNHLGYESFNVVRKGATKLGRFAPSGNYLIVDDEPFESLVRQVVKCDKRIWFTNLDKLLRDLKKAGVTVCDEKHTRHRVREGSDLDWKVCFRPPDIWYIYKEEGGNSGNSGDNSHKAAPQAVSSVPTSENRGISQVGTGGNKDIEELTTPKVSNTQQVPCPKCGTAMYDASLTWACPNCDYQINK